jgi:hypothetical protein
VTVPVLASTERQLPPALTPSYPPALSAGTTVVHARAAMRPCGAYLGGHVSACPPTAVGLRRVSVSASLSLALRVDVHKPRGHWLAGIELRDLSQLFGERGKGRLSCFFFQLRLGLFFPPPPPFLDSSSRT